MVCFSFFGVTVVVLFFHFLVFLVFYLTVLVLFLKGFLSAQNIKHVTESCVVPAGFWMLKVQSSKTDLAIASFVNQEGGKDGHLRAHVTGLKLQGPESRPIKSERLLGDTGIGDLPIRQLDSSSTKVENSSQVA